MVTVEEGRTNLHLQQTVLQQTRDLHLLHLCFPLFAADKVTELIWRIIQACANYSDNTVSVTGVPEHHIIQE